MDDLISRHAAIDALSTPHGILYPIRTVEELPPVQPEIIRCKDCKYFEYDHPYIIQGIPVLGHEVCNAWGGGCKTDENGYCFMAERREEKEEVMA